MRIKRIYHHYEKWEDYLNGMYRMKYDNEPELIEKAKSILCNPPLFMEVAKEVINNWRIATDVNLSNESTNRNAWIGQASCCYKYSVPELVTRKAWGELQPVERKQANDVAEKILNHWTLVKISKTYGAAQLSFEF